MTSSQSLNKNYDIILIGSGMGALTVASLMAQLRNKRVLVLERHFRAGGFTHSFKRKQFHFDPGIHYIGQVGEDSNLRQLLDLVTNKGVDWLKIPEPIETFVYPELKFNVYGDPKQYQADLIQLFPDEALAIRQYFKDLLKGAAALFLYTVQINGTFAFKIFAWLGRTFWTHIPLDLTTQAYLDQHFQNPQLKALLVFQWGDYGMPPEQSPFALHATIASHYLEGAYYPIGGPGKIADCVKKIVAEKGGKFLLNREVREILLDGGAVAGVRVHKSNEPDNPHSEEYYAPVVVSNIGVVNTYLKLIPSEYPIPFRESLQNFLQNHAPATHVSLYLGLKDDPRKFGFKGRNYWLYGQFDHNDLYRQRGTWIENGTPQQAFLSFPSLKNPEAKAHTAEVITFTDYDSFAQWKEQEWLHRDRDYQALKERLSQGLLDFIDSYYPGFSDLVEFCEVSTPITNEHFTAHPQGAIYGFPWATERFKPENKAWTQVKTPIPGLYLTGVDVYMMGFAAAMISGVMTTSYLPDGIPLPQAFSANR